MVSPILKLSPFDKTDGLPTGNSARVLNMTPVANGFNIGNCLS